ncbi:hypothetical protein [Novosphingobium rosa]|uniref:hypothetical protein n=1 Tax=Novosphingobium rosa TaxID=76978 RepID=UPI00082E2E32|nr:hypothetical protein [Novosphingobium rosa]
MIRITPSHLIRRVAVLALGFAAVDAQATTPHSFRDIDFSANGTELPLAEQAFARQLAPSGAPVAQASAALRKAGAHQLRTAPNGDLRFAYATTDVAYDLLRDTQLVIRVAQQNGQVTSVTVAQTTYGG